MTDVFNDQEMMIMFFGTITMVVALIAWYFLHDSNVIGQQNPQSDAEMEARVTKRRLSKSTDDDTWLGYKAGPDGYGFYGVSGIRLDNDDWDNDIVHNPASPGYVFDHN